MQGIISTTAITKIFLLATIAFVVTVCWTPLLTHFLYKYKLGKTIRVDPNTPIFSQMHQKKSGTPVMGGLLIWVTTLVIALVFYSLAKWTTIPLFHQLNFLSRSQTLLPLGALVASALVGLVDDFFNVRRMGPKGGGLSMKHRLLIYTLIALVGAVWFFYKLDWDTFHIPFFGDLSVGIWYIPIFVFIIVASSFSVNEIDGLDGLSGGTLLSAFVAFGAIAFLQGRIELAAFCAVICGALLAFLWFNIPPARFFMGDTGAMSLGVTLGIVAMLTNTALLLPIIGLLFLLESLSVIVQVLSKKIRKKKVFLSAPFHHHLEAIGWPEQKIVMRFWVIGAVLSVLGVMFYIVQVPR
ncbi:MAG: phospho-N-acetylmuramoyl-pentapeptide-transferase [bacterium]